MVAEHWGAVAALAGVVLLGKLVSAALGVFLTGGGTRTALETGMSLAQIGEFSFIIAGVGVASGAVGDFLFPVAVSVSALTMVTTPWMVRIAPRAATSLDRKLPRRLQTFAALYGSWIERLGGAARERTSGASLRRLAGLITLDAALLGALAISAAVWGEAFTRRLAALLGGSATLAHGLAIGGALALAAPLVLGIVRVARRVGATLARVALPDAAAGEIDLAIAPRRMLVVTLQLATVLLVGLPLLALLRPFVPAGVGALGLGLALAALSVGFWRSTEDLQGHVRAGAAAILEAFAAQAQGGRATSGEAALGPVRQLLPGIGEPEAVTLRRGSAACGRSLSDLDLRGLTGATVLAITRSQRSVVFPAAAEVLEAGDVLALAGSREAVAAAKALLAAPAPEGAAAP
jgi:CPA2 family monovalent cation:H+ antiporter-2